MWQGHNGTCVARIPKSSLLLAFVCPGGWSAEEFIKSRGQTINTPHTNTHGCHMHLPQGQKNNKRLTRAVFVLSAHLVKLKAVRPNTCGKYPSSTSGQAAKTWGALPVEAKAASFNQAAVFLSHIYLSFLSKQTSREMALFALEEEKSACFHMRWFPSYKPHISDIHIPHQIWARTHLSVLTLQHSVKISKIQVKHKLLRYECSI